MSNRYEGCDYYDFLRAHAFASPWDESWVNIIIARHKTGQQRSICKPLEFDTEVPAGAPIEPTFRLCREEAQDLMDRLWECGLRPSQAKASAGQTEAVLRHLEDMRVLAFNALEIPKP